MGCLWNGDSWTIGNQSGYNYFLSAIGNWATGYRPTKVRVTFTGADTAALFIGGTTKTICSNSPYASGEEAELDFSGGEDINALYLHISGYTDLTITNIEFSGTDKFAINAVGNWTNDFYPYEMQVKYIPPSGTSTTALKVIDKEDNNIIDINDYASDAWTKIQWVGTNEIYKIELTPNVVGEFCIYNVCFRGYTTQRSGTGRTGTGRTGMWRP